MNLDNSVILTTNQCNNNCIMCPDSDKIRQTKLNGDINRFQDHINCMDKDTPFICITGGEPTLLKENLFTLLDMCKNRFQHTEFLMLSNGRVFYYDAYTKEFIKHCPNNIIIGIPIHSSNEETHYAITRVKGSYKQTVKGIENLLNNNILVEIRIVITKFNYSDLKNIAEMIIERFPNCCHVSFMAMEVLGNAYVNRDAVWVDFADFKYYLEEACMKLLTKGIRAYIYNMPLCYIDKKFWSITKKSITDYKVRYDDSCRNCKVKEDCGGFFFSTKKFMNLKGLGIH